MEVTVEVHVIVKIKLPLTFSYSLLCYSILMWVDESKHPFV